MVKLYKKNQTKKFLQAKMCFLWGKKPKKLHKRGDKNALNKNVFHTIKSSNCKNYMI